MIVLIIVCGVTAKMTYLKITFNYVDASILRKENLTEHP